MKNEFKKILISLSFILILCSCETPSQEADATMEVLSEESVPEDTEVADTTSETFTVTETPTESSLAETEQPESSQESAPIESTTEESLTSQEPSSQEIPTPEASTAESTAPEYTIEPMDQIMYAQNAVNLREGPSTNYAKAGSLTKGQEVHVIGKASTGWYQLENDLFVSSSYLDDSAPAAAPAPTPEPTPDSSNNESSSGPSVTIIDNPGMTLVPGGYMLDGVFYPFSNNMGNTSNSDSGNSSSNENTPAPQEPAQSATNNQSFIEEVVNLVNTERANAGLGALNLDGTVQAAATVRVTECVTSFSHTRPSGAAFYTALDEQGASYSTAGENIAYGQTSPQEVVDAWMNSQGHRDNIMNGSYTRIGVGYCEDANGTDYWCQIFTG